MPLRSGRHLFPCPTTFRSVAEHTPDAISDTLDAGAFSTWVEGVLGAIGGRSDSDVPCGDCTGCCTSSQFVHIAPDELDTLRHIPPELLFPAPGAPRGHRLLGYDARGHCPMLADGKCTIYHHRPRTCRIGPAGAPVLACAFGPGSECRRTLESRSRPLPRRVSQTR